MSACVRLRLQRWGVKNNPAYRIVAASRESKRDGRYIELLGNYDPIPHPITGLKRLQIKKDRALYWVAVGAEPSSRVAWLMSKAGLLPEPPVPTAKTISAQPKKKAQDRLAAKAKKAQEEAAKVAETQNAELEKASHEEATKSPDATVKKATASSTSAKDANKLASGDKEKAK